MDAQSDECQRGRDVGIVVTISELAFSALLVLFVALLLTGGITATSAIWAPSLRWQG